MSLSGGCAESVMMRGMVIDMEEARLQTIAQVRAFLEGATEIAFRVPKAERYPFIERVLTRVWRQLDLRGPDLKRILGMNVNQDSTDGARMAP